MTTPHRRLQPPALPTLRSRTGRCKRQARRPYQPFQCSRLLTKGRYFYKPAAWRARLASGLAVAGKVETTVEPPRGRWGLRCFSSTAILTPPIPPLPLGPGAVSPRESSSSKPLSSARRRLKSTETTASTLTLRAATPARAMRLRGLNGRISAATASPGPDGDDRKPER